MERSVGEHRLLLSSCTAVEDPNARLFYRFQVSPLLFERQDCIGGNNISQACLLWRMNPVCLGFTLAPRRLECYVLLFVDSDVS